MPRYKFGPDGKPLPKDGDSATPDMVNSPGHYAGANGLEVIDVIEAFGLDKNFAIANAIKYLLRAGKKGSMTEDYRKACWYINHEIKKREKEAKG